MRRITDPAILRAFRHFDLGPVNRTPRCKGYSAGCTCRGCLSLARQIAERGFDRDGKVKAPPKPTQPWEKGSKAA